MASWLRRVFGLPTVDEENQRYRGVDENVYEPTATSPALNSGTQIELTTVIQYDDDPERMRAAAQALSGSTLTSGTQINLVALVQYDENPERVRAAAQALSGTTLTSGTQINLVTLIQYDDDPNRRAAAALALGRR